METRLTQPIAATDQAVQSAIQSDDAAKLLADYVAANLDENSAQDILTIDIRGKSSVADYIIIASGRSHRHVGALADYLLRGLKEMGHKNLGIEGLEGCDWVLIDIGDAVVHIFRPEVRLFYNLEKIWSVPLPQSLTALPESGAGSKSAYGSESISGADAVDLEAQSLADFNTL